MFCSASYYDAMSGNIFLRQLLLCKWLAPSPTIIRLSLHLHHSRQQVLQFLLTLHQLQQVLHQVLISHLQLSAKTRASKDPRRHRNEVAHDRKCGTRCDGSCGSLGRAGDTRAVGGSTAFVSSQISPQYLSTITFTDSLVSAPYVNMTTEQIHRFSEHVYASPDNSQFLTNFRWTYAHSVLRHQQPSLRHSLHRLRQHRIRHAHVDFHPASPTSHLQGVHLLHRREHVASQGHAIWIHTCRRQRGVLYTLSKALSRQQRRHELAS